MLPHYLLARLSGERVEFHRATRTTFGAPRTATSRFVAVAGPSASRVTVPPFIAPRIDPTVHAACRFLPFRLAGQGHLTAIKRRSWWVGRSPTRFCVTRPCTRLPRVFGPCAAVRDSLSSRAGMAFTRRFSDRHEGVLDALPHVDNDHLEHVENKNPPAIRGRSTRSHMDQRS